MILRAWCSQRTRFAAVVAVCGDCPATIIHPQCLLLFATLGPSRFCIADEGILFTTVSQPEPMVVERWNGDVVCAAAHTSA
jgi:hypothetical protein